MAAPTLLDRLWHGLRFSYLTSEQVNAETGTMDDYCSCWLCRRKGRV